MTQEETAKVLAILKAAYPNSYRGMTKSEAMGTIAVWHLHFQKLPVEIVMMAVQKCIGESTFPPSISEVKKKLQQINWESGETLSLREEMLGLKLTETERKKAEWICANTRDYKYTIPDAPSLVEMICDDGMTMLIESKE